jgi:OFA family oxalate/formate antiporter-like MFS transporter
VAVAVSGWVPALVQTQRRYPHRLGLALGIVSSGVGIGMLTVVPLCQLLIEAYGWRTAFRVLGVACVVWVVPVALYLMRSSPRASVESAAVHRRDTSSTAATHGPTLAQALRTLPFWLLFAAFFLGSMSSQTLHVHQVVYLVDHDVPAIVAATVVGVVGGCSVVAKIASGWLSDRIGRELVFAGGIGVLVIAVGALVLVGTWPSTLGAYGYAVLLGVGYSVTAALPPAMAADRYSGSHFGAIVGIGLLGAAVGSALGPWLAGWLFDRTGSYALPLGITAVVGVLAASASLWMWRLRRAAPSAAVASAPRHPAPR